MPVDWSAVRADFPALRQWTFLNTATFGQTPARSKAAIDAHFARRDEFACNDFLDWFEDMDELRRRIGRLLSCDASSIAFVPNASAALSLLLGRLDWKTGDQIVTLTDEFPNHYYYPAWLRRHGVELVETPFEKFWDAVTPRTRLVACSTMNYATGFRPPLEALSEELRRRGILLYLDATQGIAALDYNLERIRPAMFAANGYKWLLSPPGAAFFSIDAELRERLDPLCFGWRSDAGWKSVEALNHGEPVLEHSAAKYENGMLAFPSLYGMSESIRMVLEIGMEAIEARVLHLAAAAAAVLRECGGVIRHEMTPVVAAHFEDRDPGEMATALRGKGILVAARHGNLRVSPHFYNNEEDIERLSVAL